MDSILTVQYVVPIVGAAVGVFIWRRFGPSIAAFFSRQPKEKVKVGGSSEATDEGKTVRARVYDVDRRVVGMKDIPIEDAEKIKEKHGSLGRQYVRYGQNIYVFQLKDSKYSSAPVGASGDPGISPRKIGMALNQDALGVWYRVQPTQSMMQKLQPILIWSAAVLFIIFMMVVD